MKSKSIKYLNLILALFLFLFAVGYTYAWFSDDKQRNLDFEIETSGYFAGGTGSSSDPFTIVSPVHLYNLAWLQNTGRLTQSYHFSVSNNIDMGNTVLPPIGNDTHPFIGSFNGNGYAISNLKISTDISELTNAYATTNYEFSKSVGMFGIISNGASVSNYILNNPIVKVAKSGNNTHYSSATNSRAVAGLAVGFLSATNSTDSSSSTSNSSISNVGVNGGKLIVNENDYTTYNSIVGGNTDTAGGTVNPNVSDTGYFIPMIFRENLLEQYPTPTDASFVHAASDKNNDINFKTDQWILGSQWYNSDMSAPALGLGAFSIITHSSNTNFKIANDKTYAFGTSISYYKNSSSTSTPTSTISLGDATSNSILINPNGGSYSEITHYYQINNGSATSDNPYTITGDSLPITPLENTNNTTSSTVVNASIKFILRHASDAKPAKITLMATGNGSRTLNIFRIADIPTNDSVIYKYFDSNHKENDSTLDPVYSLPINGSSHSTPSLGEFEIKQNGIYSIRSSSAGTRIQYLSVSGIAGSESDGVAGVGSNVDFIYDNVALTGSDQNYTFTVVGGAFEPSQVIISFENGTLSDGSTYIIYFDRRVINSSVVFNVYYTSSPAPTQTPNTSGTANITLTNSTAGDFDFPDNF